MLLFATKVVSEMSESTMERSSWKLFKIHWKNWFLKFFIHTKFFHLFSISDVNSETLYADDEYKVDTSENFTFKYRCESFIRKIWIL